MSWLTCALAIWLVFNTVMTHVYSSMTAVYAAHTPDATTSDKFEESTIHHLYHKQVLTMFGSWSTALHLGHCGENPARPERHCMHREGSYSKAESGIRSASC